MSRTTVRELAEADLEAFSVVVANAYPSMQDSPAERQRMRERWIAQEADPSVHLYGAFRKGVLQGGMQLYDFSMTMGTAQVPVGGVGMVAVDLLHKKEHVARDLMAFFLNHYRTRGMPLALLYPFRPDFYKQMGFGYGSKMNEYRVHPAALPKGGSKEHLVVLDTSDSDQLLDYYNSYQSRTYGMLRRSTFEMERKFANPLTHIVGYRRDGRLHGYLQYRFRSTSDSNFLLNNLEVSECLYDTPEVLAELLTFLQSQADQIRTVVFWTQEDDFHYLLLDPRNGSDYLMPHVYHESNTQGLGLMYRVLDTVALLRFLDQSRYAFEDLTRCLYIEVADSFLPDNSGLVVAKFDHGRIQSVERATSGSAPVPEPVEEPIRISVDIADFSSLVLGAVGFKTLYTYGLAKLSDPGELDRVHRLFQTPDKPRCVTAF
ncbi:MAG: GNAT family N-acetyltransferase [Chloroflexi bacterium]|nr:MAG: GNAT family N-acetyltransferase [Chloroflexota bacterium]